MKSVLCLWLSLGLLVSASQTPQSQQIGGRVVEEGRDRPVGDVLITLVWVADESGGAPQAPERARQRTVRSGSNGRFAFDALAPGTYVLRVSGTDLVPASAARVLLRRNQSVTDVVLTPRRFGTVMGTVRDGAGDAVVGHPITAFVVHRDVTMSLFVPRGTATTDDSGQFRISGLSPAAYLICACGRESFQLDPHLVRGFVASGADVSQAAMKIDRTVPVFAPTFFPSASLSRDARSVDVGSGESLYGVDINLTPVPSRRVAGRVLGAPAGVIRGLSVVLFPVDEDPAAMAISGQLPASLSDDGQFHFSTVVPGTYRLEVFPTDGTKGWRGSSPVTVTTDHDIDGAMVRLTKGVSVSGRVEFAGQGLAPTDAERSKARVSLVPVTLTVSDLIAVGDSGAIGYGAQVQTDGSFVIEGVPPATYRINATGFGALWYRDHILGPSTRGHTVTIDEDNAYAGLTVGMTNTPRGTVQGQAVVGAYEVGAIVAVFPTDLTALRDEVSLTSRVLSANVDAAGGFLVRDIPPGDYFVALLPPGTRAATPAILQSLARSASRVSIQPGGTHAVTVKR